MLRSGSAGRVQGRDYWGGGRTGMVVDYDRIDGRLAVQGWRTGMEQGSAAPMHKRINSLQHDPPQQTGMTTKDLRSASGSNRSWICSREAAGAETSDVRRALRRADRMQWRRRRRDVKETCRYKRAQWRPGMTYSMADSLSVSRHQRMPNPPIAGESGHVWHGRRSKRWNSAQQQQQARRPRSLSITQLCSSFVICARCRSDADGACSPPSASYAPT